MIRGSLRLLAVFFLWSLAAVGMSETLLDWVTPDMTVHKGAPRWIELSAAVATALLVSFVIRNARRKGFDDGEMNIIEEDLRAEAAGSAPT